jgi:hypothetical protein
LMSVTRPSISTCMSCSCVLSSSPAMVSANTKQNGRQHRGGTAHKGAQTNVVIKFLSILTTHTGRPATNQWNSQKIGGAVAWRNKIFST